MKPFCLRHSNSGGRGEPQKLLTSRCYLLLQKLPHKPAQQRRHTESSSHLKPREKESRVRAR